MPARQANSVYPPRTVKQPQACSIGRWSGAAPVQIKEAAVALVIKSCLGVLARQANSLHPPHTEEHKQPQACSIGLRSVTAPMQSKEKGGDNICLCRQIVCIRLCFFFLGSCSA